MKLGYYKDQKWEQKWINEAITALETTYEKNYKSIPGEVSEDMETDFGEEDELSKYIYGR